MLPTYVTKVLAAASSTSIGSFSSAGVVTLSCALLDTARRITVVGTSILGPTFTISGLNQGLNAISESITTSTAVGGSGTTTQDFIKVTAVTISCALASSAGGLIGTSTQGGTPWVPVDTTRNPMNLGFNIDITSPSTVVIASFEYTTDYPFYNPNTGLWQGSSPTAGPRPVISSLGSSVTLDTIGTMTGPPIAAWRITLTSSSSSAGSVAATVLQSG